MTPTEVLDLIRAAFTTYDTTIDNTVGIELDIEDRTVTVQPGINMLKLSEELRKHGFIYPDNPASYPCSLVGGRIGTSGWSLIGGRYGHTRDLVISFVDGIVGCGGPESAMPVDPLAPVDPAMPTEGTAPVEPTTG